MRPSLLLLAMFLLCGCSRRADQVFVARGRLVTAVSGAQPGYAYKRLREKAAAPPTVVADDGSLCRLTAERFAGIDVGDWLLCEWTIAPDTTATIARMGA